MVINPSIIRALSSSLCFYLAETAASLEVRMVQGLLSCDSLSWVHLHHSLHEVETLLVYLSEITAFNGLNVMDFWKFHADELWILQEMFLMLSSQRAETLLYEVQLIEIILSRKQRLSIYNFSHHTANGPDIDRPIVIIPANQQLRRPIPPRRHIIRHDLIIGNAPREAQVTDLDCSCLANQYIFWFDITMDDVDTMHIRDTLKKMVDIVPHLRCRNWSLLQDLQQVLLDILTD